MWKHELQRPVNPNSPEEFLKSVGPGRHIALFYENSERARKVEFAFLDAGLKKGETVLYASSSDEPEKVVGAMRALGIGPDRYMRAGKLLVRKVSDPAMDPEGPVHGLQEFLREAENPHPGPARQVNRLFDLNNQGEIANVIEIERIIGESFEGAGRTFVCSFHLSKKEHPTLGNWFTEMVKDHHGAVFAPSSSDGVAFYLKQ